ncbi:DUF1641 domain-containing protein [Nannocystaceae bacterium ST9]
MDTSTNSPSPDTLARIEAKLDRLEHRLARFDSLIEQAPGLLAIVGDSLDDFAREQGERGVDVEQAMRNLGRTFDALLRLIGSEQLQRLLESDLLLPGTLEVLGDAARALATAHTLPSARLGMFGLLRELRDPDVQRAMGFAVDVARRIGHQLEHPPIHALPEGH